MQKEVIIAVLFGSILGLIVAFGVWRSNFFIKKAEEIVTSEITLPSEEKNETVGLSLSNPAKGVVATESEVEVNGLSDPGSMIVISAEVKDYFIKVGESREFRQIVELIAGTNEIVAYSFDDTGNYSKESVVVVYSAQMAQENDEIVDATDEAEIERLVKEKVENVKNSPKFVMGTVTDITETTLQVRSVDGEIQQASLSSETGYFNTLNSTKEVGFSDMAIGDFVIVMGYEENSNEVISASRILIDSPYESTKRIVFMAKVDEVSRSTLEVSETSNGGGWEVNGAKAVVTAFGDDNGTESIRLSSIKNGDKIFACGTSDEENELSARSIHLVEFSENGEG